MKRSRFPEEQIIGILKERGSGFGLPICAASTAPATPTSKVRRGGLEVSEAKRLKTLEDESRHTTEALAG